MPKQVLPLHDLTNVNTVLGMLYDENGVYRAAFEPGEFYNTILLDTLKYGEENYVHLKYAENLSIRKGDTKARFRRWAGLTPTLRPLKEGVPPAPDKHAFETIEVGNVFSFGRWSEYTDRIDLSVVSDVVSERSLQYGELASQTKELYARKTWLASPNEFFAGFKAMNTIAFGDEILLDDLRFLIARMRRMLVKPISGKFNYICSTEFINGLIDDPRVKQYMAIEQTTGKLWGSGEPFPMFDLMLIPTMLDEFAYPDTEFPGVYEKADGKEVMRMYAVSGNTIYYLDVHEDFVVNGSTKAKVTGSTVEYLQDGTAVENHVRWEIPVGGDMVDLAAGNVDAATAEASATKCILRKSTKSTSMVDGVRTNSYTALVDAVGDVAAVNTLLDAGAFMMLPIHRGILFGMEALLKISQDGISDMPQIIVKPLGSSGVSDALNQRQSIGFKVDGFGLAIKRPESICITYGIPKNAELAALTDQYLTGEYTLMDSQFEADAFDVAVGYVAGDIVSYSGVNYIFTETHTAGAWNAAHVDVYTGNVIDPNTGTGTLRVDGVNADAIVPLSPFINGAGIYPVFSVDTAYAVADTVLYDGKPYVFIATHTAGAWNAAHAAQVKISLEANLLENGGNDPQSNIK